MRLLGLMFLFCFLVSCGQMKGEGSGSSTLRFGEAIKSSEKLGTDEQALATEVCNAFKYKRLNFPNNYFGYTYKFDVTEQACDKPALTSNRVTAQLMAEQFVSSYAGDFHKTLETDVSGVLGSLCASLNSGIIPLNTEAVSLDTVRQFAFVKTSEADIKLTLTYAKRADVSSPYLSFKGDELLVNYANGAAFRGMVVDRRTSEACPQGSVQGLKLLRTIFSP